MGLVILEVRRRNTVKRQDSKACATAQVPDISPFHHA